MRHTALRYQASPKRLKTMLDPTGATPLCKGMCNQISDESAVTDRIPTVKTADNEPGKDL